MCTGRSSILASGPGRRTSDVLPQTTVVGCQNDDYGWYGDPLEHVRGTGTRIDQSGMRCDGGHGGLRFGVDVSEQAADQLSQFNWVRRVERACNSRRAGVGH
jgi:hypothetical protein